MTDLQRRFVEALQGEANGNATEAAQIAGYCPNGDENAWAAAGSRALRSVKVQEALKERQDASPEVATRKERQAWWTSIMNGVDPQGLERPSLRERIKASELLGKTGGDFVDRQEGDLTIRVLREAADG